MKICIVVAPWMPVWGPPVHAGFTVSLVDLWERHVEVINRDGLFVDGIGGEVHCRIPATTDIANVTDIDMAIILVDANSTSSAGASAAKVLAQDGFVLTLQNGIGNLDKLDIVLGKDRVVGGLSYHSAALRAPGHVSHTHAGPTWIGNRNDGHGQRIRNLAAVLDKAGLNPTIVEDIESLFWKSGCSTAPSTQSAQ